MNTLRYIVFIMLVGTTLNAQTPKEENPSSTKNSPVSITDKQKEAPEFIFKPYVGLGVGMLSFYGDLYDKKFQSPTVSRIAYELNVSQQLSDYLHFNFYVLKGKLGANENYTSGTRNLNFESQITAGGINLMYDFSNFLSEEHTANPYITIGIESFEFLTKTDLYDKNGNKYFYWKDGSIRDRPQSSPFAADARILQRDYTYESDVRELNEDGFGKYAERSWAIPVGAGFNFKLNDYFNFKIGATMHFTFTDYIDGVTKNSLGNRVGNGKNDKFMMTSFALSYNFGLPPKDESIEELIANDPEFLALDNDDMDKDGVADIIDKCPGTPAGVAVDKTGCPPDDDKDGVPNYKDEELTTPLGLPVDEKGVQLTDSIIAYRYNVYTDSTGAFSEVETHEHNGKINYANPYQKEYAVSLGTFKKGLPPELMTKFLSVNDISSTLLNDSSTIYTAGKFNNLLDAEKRKQQLVSMGLTDAKLVEKKNGKYIDAPKLSSNVITMTNDKNTTTDNKEEKATKGTTAKDKNTTKENTSLTSSSEPVVFRVQLGAYQHRLSKNVFNDINDLIEIKTDDGLYKYMTGSFSTIGTAAKHKVDMLLKGYEGAFITAYKNGKRVSLQEAGATISKKSTKEDVNDNKSISTVNKKLVIFKVQLATFKTEPPEDKKQLFEKIKNITTSGNRDGSTKYLAGEFNNYADAEALKNKIQKEFGLTDAFVAAFFNNESITIQDALELLK